MDYVKVKDKDYLIREVESNGIVNTDYENYKKYVESYKQKLSETKKIKDLQEEVSSIKEDLGEIKGKLIKSYQRPKLSHEVNTSQSAPHNNAGRTGNACFGTAVRAGAARCLVLNARDVFVGMPNPIAQSERECRRSY